MLAQNELQMIVDYRLGEYITSYTDRQSSFRSTCLDDQASGDTAGIGVSIYGDTATISVDLELPFSIGIWNKTKISGELV